MEALVLSRQRRNGAKNMAEVEALVTLFKAQMLSCSDPRARELLLLWRELGASWGEVAQEVCGSFSLDSCDDADARAEDARGSEERWSLSSALSDVLLADGARSNPAVPTAARKTLEELFDAASDCGADEAEEFLEAGRLSEARRMGAKLLKQHREAIIFLYAPALHIGFKPSPAPMSPCSGVQSIPLFAPQIFLPDECPLMLSLLLALLVLRNAMGTRPARHSLEKILEDVQAMERPEKRFRYHLLEPQDPKGGIKTRSQAGSQGSPQVKTKRTHPKAIRSQAKENRETGFSTGRLEGFHQLDLSDEESARSSVRPVPTSIPTSPTKGVSSHGWSVTAMLSGDQHFLRVKDMVFAWIFVAAFLTLALLCCCNVSLLTMTPRK
eukprot:symbB.v1.2.032491.t1/scaffold3907.1/size48466/3